MVFICFSIFGCTGPGDLPSVHAGLRYWVVFFVLTRFRLLVGMEECRLIYIPRRRTGSECMGEGMTRADRLNATENPMIVLLISVEAAS